MKKELIISVLLAGFLISGSVVWESDLIFSHIFHHEDAGARCYACHVKALTSTGGQDDLLPQMQTCYNCHDEDMECTSCHKNGEEPLLLPRITDYSKTFNHGLHTENGVECLTCHKNIDDKEVVDGSVHLPVMDDCMTCHTTPEEKDGCYLCHDREEELRPADHTIAWNTGHGMFAESGSQICNSCHAKNYCIECHSGNNLFNQSHPADFIATHSLSYMIRESDCASCHGGKDYCIECHVEVNHVLPVTHTQPDWAAQEHGESARTDSENCTVCHSSGDVMCIECHN